MFLDLYHTLFFSIRKKACIYYAFPGKKKEENDNCVLNGITK